MAGVVREPKVSIEEVFQQFLADQRERLRPKTFSKYRDIIELFTHCLNEYASSGLAAAERKRFDQAYRAKGQAHREFCQLFGPEHILGNLGEFLNYFMIRKVMAGTELLQAAGTVTKRLAKWLSERGYVDEAYAAAAAEGSGTAAAVLPRLRVLADRLQEYAAGTAVRGAEQRVEGHFRLVRTEVVRVWVEDQGGAEYGPIPLPADIIGRWRVGWSVSGALVNGRQGWRFAEAWNGYPY